MTDAFRAALEALGADDDMIRSLIDLPQPRQPPPPLLVPGWYMRQCEAAQFDADEFARMLGFDGVSVYDETPFPTA